MIFSTTITELTVDEIVSAIPPRNPVKFGQIAEKFSFHDDRQVQIALDKAIADGKVQSYAVAGGFMYVLKA